MRKAEARHLETSQAPVASANGCRPPPIGAKLSLLTSTSPPSSRKPVWPKSPISLAKRAIRDPLAPAIREDPGSCTATANGSRLTDFSDQIKDLEKSRVRDDGAGGLSKLAPMGLRRQDGGVGIWGSRPRRHPGAGHPGLRGLPPGKISRVCELNPSDSPVQVEQLILRASRGGTDYIYSIGPFRKLTLGGRPRLIGSMRTRRSGFEFCPKTA